MLIVDTGVLVAAADRSDPQHSRCAPLVADASGQMRTTAMVIAEAAYLIERELGPHIERLLYDSIIAGDIAVEHLTIDDWKRTAELVTRYDNLPLGDRCEPHGARRATRADRNRNARPPALHRRPPRPRPRLHPLAIGPTTMESAVPHACHAQGATGDNSSQHVQFKPTTKPLLRRHNPSVWTYTIVSLA